MQTWSQVRSKEHSSMSAGPQGTESERGSRAQRLAQPVTRSQAPSGWTDSGPEARDRANAQQTSRPPYLRSPLTLHPDQKPPHAFPGDEQGAELSAEQTPPCHCNTAHAGQLGLPRGPKGSHGVGTQGASELRVPPSGAAVITGTPWNRTSRGHPGSLWGNGAPPRALVLRDGAAAS